jgi:hypothetical protein
MIEFPSPEIPLDSSQRPFVAARVESSAGQYFCASYERLDLRLFLNDLFVGAG